MRRFNYREKHSLGQSKPIPLCSGLQPKLDDPDSHTLLMQESIHTQERPRISCHRTYQSAHSHAVPFFQKGATQGSHTPAPSSPTHNPLSILPFSMTSSELMTFLLHNHQPTAHIRAGHALLRRVHHRQTFSSSSCITIAFAQPFQQSGRQPNEPSLCAPQRQKKTQPAARLERISCQRKKRPNDFADKVVCARFCSSAIPRFPLRTYVIGATTTINIALTPFHHLLNVDHRVGTGCRQGRTRLGSCRIFFCAPK